MRVLSAKPVGINDCWKVIDVVVEIDGRPVTGQMNIEIDGRDIELNGDLAGHKLDWEAIWSDEAGTAAIEAACMAIPEP